MSHCKISITNTVRDDITIIPDVIFNRYDLYNIKNEYGVIVYTDESNRYAVQFRCVSPSSAELGIYLSTIPEDVLRKMITYLFKKRKKLRTLTYRYYYCLLGVGYAVNHYKVCLPTDSDELDSRLSAKSRYNIKREKRILSDTFGGFTVLEYPVDEVPDSIADLYIKMKNASYNCNWTVSGRQYMEGHNVSHVYVLQLTNDLTVAAVLLSCENTAVVFLENLSFDLDYSKYSVGTVLYDEYLKILIRKGKREVFLMSGEYEYKKRYNGIEERVYSGTVYGKTADKIKYQYAPILSKKVKRLRKRIVRRTKRILHIKA